MVIILWSLGMTVSSAPRAAIWTSLSSLNASEVTIRRRYPFAARTSARDAPVEPPVYSTTVSPGRSRPSSSALAIIARAIRSFMLPVGFCPSTLTKISAHPAGTTLFSRTNGVFPIAAVTSFMDVIVDWTWPDR